MIPMCQEYKYIFPAGLYALYIPLKYGYLYEFHLNSKLYSSSRVNVADKIPPIPCGQIDIPLHGLSGNYQKPKGHYASVRV